MTLLEKLDAIHRRFPNEKAEPAAFVRHYEDAARVIGGEAGLPTLTDYRDVRALAEDMLTQRQIATLAKADDPAFALADGERTRSVREAHARIGAMFWGSRTSLDGACETIRSWVARWFGEEARVA